MNKVAVHAFLLAVSLAGPCTLAPPAAAQGVIGGYRAYIGQADLRNSRGAVLTQPWQVIRQDRANVHRFGISQPGDERDPWFSTGEMRIALENWLRYGGLNTAPTAAIMAGNVSIYVEVLGQGSRASGVRVYLDPPNAGTGSASSPGAPFADDGGAAGADLGGSELIIDPE